MDAFLLLNQNRNRNATTCYRVFAFIMIYIHALYNHKTYVNCRQTKTTASAKTECSSDLARLQKKE